MKAVNEEIVQIVDKNNLEIDVVPRSIMRQQRLIHRAVYIIVFNSSGEILIQKRTKTKDVYPGYWDLAAGGVVLAGESYPDAASRELTEELGIKNIELAVEFDQYFEDETNKVWGKIYTCIDNGPFTLQKEEIDFARFIEPEKIFKLDQTEPFTPDSLPILKKLLMDQ